MNWVNPLIVILFLCIPCFSQIGGRTQVAVMNLETSGIESSAMMALTDRLRSELINTGQFDVMERGKMDEILQEQGFQQTGACNTNECLVQAGRMLGVARMIAGSVGKVGRMYTASARVIDIETGRVMISKTEDCDCPIENVLTVSMRNLAKQLGGVATEVAATKTVQPVVVDGKGDFYFKSDPLGAKVYIDDQPVEGVTPNSAEGIQSGVHVIRMTTGEFSVSETISLEPNEFKRVELKLNRGTGGLKIITQPFEASVYIDDKLMGLSPQNVSNISSGEHVLKIQKEGYIDAIKSIIIKVNEVSRIEIIMIKIGSDMVFITAGSFSMGSIIGDADEKPVHRVTLKAYLIGKSEITNTQYANFLNAWGKDTDENGQKMIAEHNRGFYKNFNSWEPKLGYENYPVVRVTWFGAVQFAKFVGGRLPTEAEWEYAARGGDKSKNYIYAGSNKIEEVAWYRSYSVPDLHPVGQKSANEIGLYDMSGNVAEWCMDRYSDYSATSEEDPQGSISGLYRVIRGGSSFNFKNDCRSTDRDKYRPDDVSDEIGFRIVIPGQ